MKRFVALLCLFVIMFQSMSTLCIYTAFIINRDYISENLCINRFDKVALCKGKCYLEGKLKANEKQEKKLPDLQQKEAKLFCEENDLIVDFSLMPSKFENSPNTSVDFSISNFSASIFHPPPFA